MNDSSEKSVILVVEDDAESREMLSELLTEEGTRWYAPRTAVTHSII